MNSNPLVDQLKKVLRGGDAVFVIGTGVSASVTRTAAWPKGNPVAMWRGLLESGIRRCGNNDLLGDNFVERWLPIIKHGGVPELLGVGDVIDEYLKTDSVFVPWLDDTVGSLQVNDSTLIDVINSFDALIMTTNYDNLFETVTKRRPLSILHRYTMEILHNAREAKEAILHLHGYWDNEDNGQSIVLGWRSYYRLLQDERIVQREAALGHTKSFVFVGFGAGFSDPHFNLLMSRLGKSLEETRYFHFLLLPEGEADQAAARLPPASHVRVLNYGAIDNLAAFLKTLLPEIPLATQPLPAPPSRELDEEGTFGKRFVGRKKLLNDFTNLIDTILPSDRPKK